MSLTPQKAAEIAGVSRPAIMSAIASGKLVARRANSGNKWIIQENDLRDWMHARTTQGKLAAAATYTAGQGADTATTAEEIAALKSQLETLRGELSAAKQEVSRLGGRLEEKDNTINLLSDLLKQRGGLIRRFWRW